MRTWFPIGVVLLILLAIPGVVVFAADLLGYGPSVNAWLQSQFSISHRVAIALPAALMMFLIPPIIVLLYFLRLKRKPITVPSTFLWKKSIEDLHVNRLMQWLRANVLLLMQILAALALIYGVLGPRLHGAVSGGRYYIILIDNSASMSATDMTETKNRLEWAKGEALKEIDAATDSDFGMVIVSNDVAEIRQSYTSNRAALRRAVENIETTQRPTLLNEALSLAASRANPNRSTENDAVAPLDAEPGKERTYVQTEGFEAIVHLYSDGQFPPIPDFALSNLNLSYHVPPVESDGPGSKNVAILQFNAERDPAEPTQVIARAILHNYRSKPTTLRPRVEVRRDGDELVAIYDADKARSSGAKTTLPAQSRVPDITFTIPDVPENSDYVLHLKLEDNTDVFPLDDEAWVAMGIIRKARLLVVGPDNPLLRNFLDMEPTQKLAEVTYRSASVLDEDADPELYRKPSREGEYDLVIFDRCAPAKEWMPQASTFFIGMPPPPYQAPGVGDKVNAMYVEPMDGVFVRGWESRHPVMRGLQVLDSITAAEAFRLPSPLPPRTTRLMEGDRNLVLLAAIPRQVFTDLVLAFPLLTKDGRWNTNWPLNISFPLFMRNTILSLGNVRDAASEEPLKPGEVKQLWLGSVPKLTLTKPDDSTVTLERGPRAAFDIADTNQLGEYVAMWRDPGSGEARLRRFPVNLFDPLESDIAPSGSVTLGNTTIESDSPRNTAMDLWKWPVLVGLLVLVLEWWVYNRRVQI